MEVDCGFCLAARSQADRGFYRSASGGGCVQCPPGTYSPPGSAGNSSLAGRCACKTGYVKPAGTLVADPEGENVQVSACGGCSAGYELQIPDGADPVRAEPECTAC